MYDNGDGYVDFLAHSGESVNTAVELLLPFHSTIMYLSKFYAWWFGILGVAIAAIVVMLRLAQPVEIWRRFWLVVTFMALMIPISVTTTDSDGRRSHLMGLGPYILWKGFGGFDAVMRSGVDSVLVKLSGDKGRLPLHFYQTLNSTFSEKLGTSPAARIYNDYIYWCTKAVDPTVAGYPTWYHVGLMGGGGLGIPLSTNNMSDQVSDPGFWTWVLRNYSPLHALGDKFIQYTIKSSTKHEIESQLPQARRALRDIDFGGDLHKRNAAYKVPSTSYWRSALNLSTPGISEIQFLPVTERFLSYQDKLAMTNVGFGDPLSLKDGEDKYLHYVQNCEQLYQLADLAMSQYYDALSDYYKVGNINYRVNPDDARNATISTLKASMEYFYRNSSALAALQSNSDLAHVPGMDLKDKGILTQAKDNAFSTLMGISGGFFAFLKGLNLDKHIPTVIGSLSLAISFLIVFSPMIILFSLLLPDRGAVTWTLVKIALMLQLTLMFSYIIIKIGLMIMGVINELSAASAAGPLGMSRQLASYAQGVITFSFLAPVLSGFLAKAIVFSGQGIGNPGGDPAEATKQAATLAAATFALTRVVSPLLGSAGGAGARAISKGKPDTTPNSPGGSSNQLSVISAASNARSSASTASARFDGRTGSGVSVYSGSSRVFSQPANKSIPSSWTYGNDSGNPSLKGNDGGPRLPKS